MSLAPITLVTDKSTAVIDNAHRILRQDESGLSITVTVLNEDNTAYNLTGKNLVFCENKQNSKIIIDNGKGDNCGKFYRNSDNDTKGVFTYVLQEDAYSASGKAWFEITDGITVDSTKNFYFDVEKDAAISVANNDYIGSLQALETAMAGAQGKVTSELANMEAQITQKIATLQGQWNSELQSVKNKANTDTDSAVKAINDRYTNDFAKIKSDFVSWQTSTIQNYQKQVDAILAKIINNGSKVTDVQKQVDDTIAKMQTLTQQFSKIDFTQFLKPSALDNYYTKSELDPKLAEAGKVKSVNGIKPDDKTGDITLGWKIVVDKINADTITYTSKLFVINASGVPDNGVWGYLITDAGDTGATPIRVTQEWWADNSGSTGQPAKHYYRQITFTNQTWSPWVAQATQNDVDSLTKKTSDNATAISKNTDTVNAIRYAPQERRALGANDDANNIFDDGIYRINADPIKNGNGIPYCFLSVKHWDYNTIFQELLTVKGIFIRTISQVSKAYPAWQRIATSDDIAALQGRVTALENAKPIKASSQDDAVAKSKSSNSEYYW